MIPCTLILGAGEVGKALADVLSPFYRVVLADVNPPDVGDVDFLHICFPYSKGFVAAVKGYADRYRPQYMVIHSTVPVGTSRECGAVHSPIRGNHYDMARSIRTIVKFVGGDGADAVANHLMRAGIPVQVVRKSEATELGKLLCTTYYGVCIEFTKAAERKCRKEGVSFAEAFTLFQKTYNEGYVALGRPDVQRPVLAPIQSEIGGHCVLPNCELFDFAFAKLIKRLNHAD